MWLRSLAEVNGMRFPAVNGQSVLWQSRALVDAILVDISDIFYIFLFGSEEVGPGKELRKKPRKQPKRSNSCVLGVSAVFAAVCPGPIPLGTFSVWFPAVCNVSRHLSRCPQRLESRKTREGWNCRFQKTPRKVPGRFAFPGAQNPRVCCISRFGKHFPVVFPHSSRNETATAFELSDFWAFYLCRTSLRYRLLCDCALPLLKCNFSSLSLVKELRRRLKFIQCRAGVWKCLGSLPPDPSPMQFWIKFLDP